MIKLYKWDLNFDKINWRILSTIIICTFIIIFVRFNNFFNIVLKNHIFLSLHSILELLSILISFSIFLALYNIYDFTNSLRNVIYANTFLIVGFLDTMHLLSYEGMPRFLTENGPQKAITFWIFSRLVAAGGILVANLFDKQIKTNINKNYFLFLSIILVLTTSNLVIYSSSIIPTFFDTETGLTNSKIALEYLVVLKLIIAIYLVNKNKNKKTKELDIMIIALIIAIASEAIFTMYMNVNDSINLLGHLLKIISYFLIFKVLFVENIKKPYIRVSDMREELNTLVSNLEREVKEKSEEMFLANYKLKQINNKMNKELDAAKQIQMALIPKPYESHYNIEFYSKYLPWGKLSGDSYKYFKINDKNIGMFIIDVSGHGVSSAMLTIFADRVLTPFDAESEEEKDFYLNPKEVLRDFYKVFNESNFPDETHMVMLYGVLNIETDEFIYSSAGHNCNPIHIKNNGEIDVLKSNGGFPICKLGAIFTPDYFNEVIQLDKKDKILFYTDGLIEQANENEELYGIDRLRELIEDKNYLNSRGILKKIYDDLNIFREKKKLQDDLTMFVMSINESEAKF